MEEPSERAPAPHDYQGGADIYGEGGAIRASYLAHIGAAIADRDVLVLKLLTNDEVMEIRFPGAKVLRSDLSSQLVSRIVTLPTPKGPTRTALVDPNGTTLVELESGSPEILCRGLRTHDLG